MHDCHIHGCAPDHLREGHKVQQVVGEGPRTKLQLASLYVPWEPGHVKITGALVPAGDIIRHGAIRKDHDGYVILVIPVDCLTDARIKIANNFKYLK